MIRLSGIETLRSETAKLHHPFYVYIVEHLPENSDRAADQVIDHLAQEVQQEVGHGRANVFLLSLNPRKYRLIAGADWRTRLGLERDALIPHHQHFANAMRGTPKNPVGGIVATAQSLDRYIYEQTDPEVLRAREEAAQKQRALAAKQRREAERAAVLHKAQDIETQLERVDLTEIDEAQVQRVQKALTALNASLEAARKEEERTSAELLRDIERAETSLKEVQDTLFAEMLGRLLRFLLALAGVTAILTALHYGRKAWRSGKDRYSMILAFIRESRTQLGAARVRYVEANDQIDWLRRLPTMGRTREEIDRVDRLLEEILLLVSGKEAQIDKVESAVRRYERIGFLTKAQYDGFDSQLGGVQTINIDQTKDLLDGSLLESIDSKVGFSSLKELQETLENKWSALTRAIKLLSSSMNPPSVQAPKIPDRYVDKVSLPAIPISNPDDPVLTFEEITRYNKKATDLSKRLAQNAPIVDQIETEFQKYEDLCGATTLKVVDQGTSFEVPAWMLPPIPKIHGLLPKARLPTQTPEGLREILAELRETIISHQNFALDVVLRMNPTTLIKRVTRLIKEVEGLTKMIAEIEGHPEVPNLQATQQKALKDLKGIQIGSFPTTPAEVGEVEKVLRLLDRVELALSNVGKTVREARAARQKVQERLRRLMGNKNLPDLPYRDMHKWPSMVKDAEDQQRRRGEEAWSRSRYSYTRSSYSSGGGYASSSGGDYASSSSSSSGGSYSSSGSGSSSSGGDW